MASLMSYSTKARKILMWLPRVLEQDHAMSRGELHAIQKRALGMLPGTQVKKDLTVRQ